MSELNLRGTFDGDLLAAGGICPPQLGTVVSMSFTVGSDHVFTFARPHRLRDRVKAWFAWNKDWWMPLGYPLRPIHYYFPAMSVKKGDITYSKDGWTT